MTTHLPIVSITKASPTHWGAVCASCDHATYFHTPGWAAIWERYTRGAIKADPLAITFSDGAQAIVCVSIKRSWRNLIRVAVSSAAGTYGGWISTMPLSQDNTRALVDLLRSYKNLIWRENPYDSALTELEIPGATEDFTQVIDLRTSLNALYEDSNRAHHKALRKADASGITIRTADTLDDWEAYFGVYQDSLRRWAEGGPEKQTHVFYSRELFRILHEHDRNQSKLWVAVHNDRIIAGIIVFYWNHHVVAWHGAASGESFNLRPNNKLYWEILKDAHTKGYWWFDCNPSGGYSGVVLFKEFLGAVKMQSRVMMKSSFLRRIASTVKRGIKR